MDYRMLALAAAAALGCTGGTATAGRLDLDTVPADATWVTHLDMERFAGSTIGGFLREQGDELDIDMGDFEEMQRQLRMDVWHDVLSLTLYGGQDEDEDGVIVLVTNDRIDVALRRLAEIDGVEHEDLEIGDFDAHRFTFDGETHYVHVRRSRARDRNIVVLTDERDALIHACRVLSGADRSLSRADLPLSAVRPERGSIVFVAMSDVEMFEEVEAASEIARLTDTVVIDVGETDDAMFARARVSADDADAARDIVQVIQGMLALGRLIAAEDEDLAPLRDVLRGVDVRLVDPAETSSRTISLGIRLPTATIIEALHTLDEFDRDDGRLDRNGDDEDGERPASRRRERRERHR